MSPPGMIPRRAIALLALAATTAWVAAASCGPPEVAHVPHEVFPLLPHELFDEPIRVTGAFGDHRSNHFHAGLDLSTGMVVGRAVHAPGDGEVKRVRASGAGYGRSIYIETRDGRLLVFGHLDGFAEPIAGYVYAAQDSLGEYEQDLWPAAGRFTVRAGQIIGWTGRSGTGNPHLHVEIRRGDMALNPLFAGYALRDTSTPRIARVTLVALDNASWVSGAESATLAFGARDTVRANGWGRLRVVVEAVDAESDGTFDIAPWRTRVTNGFDWIECRFDSVSWATDMSQSDFVYDRGRYTAQGKTSLVIASPGGFRPRPITASAPEPQAAGIVTLDDMRKSATIAIEAEDLAGHVSRRYVRLEAVAPKHPPRPGPPALRNQLAAVAGTAGRLEEKGVARIDVPKGALCEPTALGMESAARAKATGEVTPVGATVRVAPAATPLRSGLDVALALPAGASHGRVGLYRADGDGWEYIGDEWDAAARRIGGSTRHCGRFGLFRDVRAPITRLVTPPRRSPDAPYPKWSLEATLDEQGSGVDVHATYFEIDGRRVPSEWDGVKETLRWRPPHAPSTGHHGVTVVAVDRAGNRRKTAGGFVVD